MIFKILKFGKNNLNLKKEFAVFQFCFSSFSYLEERFIASIRDSRNLATKIEEIHENTKLRI